ncbi:MAG: glycosyltransferase family 4 protein [Solirubrobacterales bacterium]
MANPTLRIGFELTVLELDNAGIARYARSLRDALESVEGLEILPVAHPASSGGKRGRYVRGLSRELRWFPRSLHGSLEALDVDVLHCPSPLAPRDPRIPAVVTIHDVLPLQHPRWFTRANVFHQRVVLPGAARAASRVIAVSTSAADAIVEVLGVDPERIEVIPSGVDPVFSPGDIPPETLSRHGLTRPYILTVGTLQPRKNVEAAIAAFERVSRHPDPHQLVLVGSRGWREGELMERVRRSPARERIKILGRVSDPDLVALYRGAQCFVFPSRAEGFGLPVLEAMACGTPVVASDRTSIPEVAGSAALLVDPDDGEAMARGLEHVVRSAPRRQELRGLGIAHASQFTWDRCASATAELYREVATGR